MTDKEFNAFREIVHGAILKALETAGPELEALARQCGDAGLVAHVAADTIKDNASDIVQLLLT
jgi:hypothetical protein